MVLVSNQAAGNLGKGLARQYGLAPFTLIAAPYAADVERRSARVALKGGVAFLTGKGVHTYGLLILLLIERYARYHLALCRGNGQHAVIEMRNCYPPMLIHHLAQHLAQRIDWVLHGAAEMPRVQVAVGTRYLHLPIRQPAQTRRDGRRVLPYHRSIGYKDDITAQQVFVLRDKMLQRWASYLLFPLKEELDLAVHQSVFHKILKRLHLYHRLPLIIVCTAGEETGRAVHLAHLRLPWVAQP